MENNGEHERESLPGLDFTEPEIGGALREHFATCRQCRDNPFNLCSQGYELVRSALN